MRPDDSEPRFELPSELRRREADRHWWGRWSLGKILTLIGILSAIGSSAGTFGIWLVHGAQAYADERVWQANVESAHQSAVREQALVNDEIKEQLREIKDQLRVLQSRMDARQR